MTNTDLDKSGQNYQHTKVYLGPSLGWQDVRVMPETVITTGGTHTLLPDAATILVDVAANVTLNLPDAAAWMRQPGAKPNPSLTRAITIKDFGGNAGTFPITITPFGSQTIDGIAGSRAISDNTQVVSLWPLNDLSGWYIEEGALGGGAGPPGTPGSEIFVQTTAPSVVGVEDGSIWIDSDSTDLDLYQLVAAAWVDTGVNLKGSTGATGGTGPTGDQGATIIVQASAPSVVGLEEGSIWIDQDSADIDLYELTGGVWVDTGTNLKGPPGGTPAGANTEVQFNSFGSFAADSGLTFDPATNVLGGLNQAYMPTGASGIGLDTTNPTIFTDPNFRRAMEVTLRYQDPLNTDPAYGTVAAQSLAMNAYNGQNVYSDEIQAKTTYMCQYNITNGYAGGQKFNQVNVVNGWGMGDVANATSFCNFASGPIAGDEGIGFTLVNNCEQSRSLHRSTIISVPAAGTIATNITANITASQSEQNISVATSAGISVGQWVNCGTEPMNVQYNGEVVQITGVDTGGANTLRGIFRNNHTNGASLTWVPTLVVDYAQFFGEGRTLVNVSSATTYSTGTLLISPYGSGEVLGNGTTWSNTMVGGTAFNVGAISFDEDTYTGSPFDGTGDNGPLRDWYQITGVTDATTLGLWSMSITGDQGYNGQATAGGTYIIRPAARVMKRLTDGQTIVLERSAHTWTVGDTVECAICPFPDVSGRQDHISVYSAGGVKRAFNRIVNQGARKLQAAIQIDANQPAGADPIAFSNGIQIGAECDVALTIANFNTYGAIQLPSAQRTSSKIIWQAVGIEIGWDSTRAGMFIQGTSSGSDGTLIFTDEGIATSGIANMSFGGIGNFGKGCRVQIDNLGTLTNPTLVRGNIAIETNTPFAPRMVFSDGTDYIPVSSSAATYADSGVDNATTTFSTLMTVNLLASKAYWFEANLPFGCDPAAGIKATIGGTAVWNDMTYQGWITDSGSNGIKGNTQATALNTTVASSTTTGATGIVQIKGAGLVNTAGTLTVRFAQNTANATPTQVKPYFHLRYGVM